MDNNSTNTLIRTQRPFNVVACGYELLTVTGASAQLLTVPPGTSYAEFRVESATLTGFIVRYLNLGATTLPTTTNGMPLSHGDVFDMSGSDAVNNFRIIAISGSHQLHVQYFR